MRNIFLCALFSILNICYNYSQKDTLNERLLQPIEQCETIAFNSQVLITSATFSQTDYVSKILDRWEISCGKSEAIQRVRILFAIQDGSFDAANYDNYYSTKLYDYSRRVYISNDTSIDNTNQYQRYKGHYDYVPLNGAFDQWTQKLATVLKHTQEESSDAYLLCVLFSDGPEAFHDLLRKNKRSESHIRKQVFRQYYNRWNSGITLTLIGGTWFPLKNDHTDFGTSPQIGIRCGIPIGKQLRVGLGTMVKIWTDRNKFEIDFNNQDTLTKSLSSFTLGAFLEKSFPIKDKFFLDLNMGAALESLATEFKKPETSNQESETISIETINFTLGTNFRVKIGKTKSLGLNLNYHFVPFNLDKELTTKLNSQALSANLLYRF